MSARTLSLLPLVLPILASTALAQKPTVTTTTELGVQATFGTASKYASIAKGTVLKTATIKAEAAVGNSRVTGGATTRVQISPASQKIMGEGFLFSTDGTVGSFLTNKTGSSQTAVATGGKLGTQKLQCVWPAKKGSTGFLTLSAGTSVTGKGTSSLKVTINSGGAARVFKLSGNQSTTELVEISVTGSTGVFVSVEAVGQMVFSGKPGIENYSMSAQVLYRGSTGNKRCSVASYGKACNNLGKFTFSEVPIGGGASLMRLAGTGAPKSSFLWLSVGTKKTSITLPRGSGCKLLAEPLVVLVMPVDGKGNLSQVLSAPAGAYSVYLQYVGIDPAAKNFATSTGFIVKCK